MSIFSRLGFNFDTTKFGNALDPYNDLEEKLDTTPSILYKWQLDAIANNDVDGYLQNPVKNTVIMLQEASANLLSLISSINDFDDANASPLAVIASNTSNNIVYEANSFIKHTDNISGMTTTSEYTIPDLDKALGVGEMILNIVNKNDGITNNSPVLGSFTSLFIKDDISSNTIILKNDYVLINNSITVSEELDENDNPIIVKTSNLTASQFQTISNNANTAYFLLNTRRTHDENYFANSLIILNEYTKMSQFSSLSPLKLYLVQNYIGTDKLKDKI